MKIVGIELYETMLATVRLRDARSKRECKIELPDVKALQLLDKYGFFRDDVPVKVGEE